MNDVQDAQYKDKKKQRLELTWIGKNEQLRLEPRILIEDPEKSCGDTNTENMLIHGDNLLALKALEQDFAGKIKCIYIDPPYNTGSAFEHFDDNLEHSTWLNLMQPRLKLLYNLLNKDTGVLFVQIDFNELAYLRVILDEIFLRQGFLGMITVKVKAPSGDASKNKKYVYDVSEYILIYSKNPKLQNNKGRVIKEIIDNKSKTAEQYGLLFNDLGKSKNIVTSFQATGQSIDVYERSNYDITSIPRRLRTREFYFDNFNIVGRTAKFSGRMYDALKDLKGLYSFSYTPERGKNAGKEVEIFVLNGEQIIYLKDYSEKTQITDEFGNKIPCVAKLEDMTNIITDDMWQGIAQEGNVDFPKSKKPEQLIKTLLEMSTKKGDLVLDSFLGSGTTVAVAHKMQRKWMGIELGEHANTHCLPRLRSVVEGDDQSGISKTVNWHGGGGFKFYNLAPSLLKKDKFGQWVIDEKYNPNMLASAMCKHEGFKYCPDPEMYWKQGKSTESDYIFVTTNFISLEQLDSIHSEMLEGESLLICTKSFSPDCESKYSNITIKKIPQAILGSCEFSKDNYDLNIIKSTEDIAEEQDEEVSEDE